MTKSKLLAAAAILTAMALTPNLAQARSHHHHHHYYYSGYQLPYPISYLHNYGPGLQPGTFAYYDGPSTNACRQSAAAYRGQDRRRHPCS
jgi:hypothetical protein